VAQLAEEWGVPLEPTLADLATQDLVQRDPATGRIRAAYPFSGVPTPHHVALFSDHSGERTDQIEATVFAMCALDALGIPMLLRRAALITSVDPHTGEAIRVLARILPEVSGSHAPLPASEWRMAWDPRSAVVYARPPSHEAKHDAGVCLAEWTCCPVTNFFATVASAQAWICHRTALEPAAVLDGHVLDQQEALERAHTLFAGVLERLTSDPASPLDSGAVDPSPDGRKQGIETWATITCPQCGQHQRAAMPTDACQVRYTCPRCGAVLRPLPGDCCVFCSYADRPCPPEQEARQVHIRR
jgi:hypothetical protein